MPYLYGDAPIDGAQTNKDIIKPSNKTLGEAMGADDGIDRSPWNPGTKPISGMGGMMQNMGNSLAEFFANKIAHPTQRPGPAGSVVQNSVTSGGHFDGEVIDIPGHRDDNMGNNPGKFIHELGHQQQLEEQGEAAYNSETMRGNINEFAHGDFMGHGEHASPNEFTAPQMGMQRLIKAAEEGDPQAQAFLKKVQSQGLGPDYMQGLYEQGVEKQKGVDADNKWLKEGDDIFGY